MACEEACPGLGVLPGPGSLPEVGKVPTSQERSPLTAPKFHSEDPYHQQPTPALLSSEAKLWGVGSSRS